MKTKSLRACTIWKDGLVYIHYKHSTDSRARKNIQVPVHKGCKRRNTSDSTWTHDVLEQQKTTSIYLQFSQLKGLLCTIQKMTEWVFTEYFISTVGNSPIIIVVMHESSRRNNNIEPHWMEGNKKKYGAKVGLKASMKLTTFVN